MSAKTVSSSSAPLITKKRIKMGVVQRSARSISSSETLEMLQNTVPSIIHASKDENEICTGPMLNLIIENATVRNMKVTDTARRFEREWKNCSTISKNYMERP